MRSDEARRRAAQISDDLEAAWQDLQESQAAGVEAAKRLDNAFSRRKALQLECTHPSRDALGNCLDCGLIR